MCQIAAIVLAAGASTRMGRPKQLLPYKGVSLVRRICNEALASSCEKCLVVVGAHAERVEAELDSLPVEIVHNSSWQEGPGSSIHSGISALQTKYPEFQAAVILLCDQPFVTAELIEMLIATYHSTQQPIVACEYGETLGVPALFARQIWSQLPSRDGGAKDIIRKHPNYVSSVPFPQGVYDVDTPDDYGSLITCDVCVH